MNADGSVIIDTKISTDGMEQGFERIKNDMGAVADTAEKVGNSIKVSFSQIDVSKPIAQAEEKIKSLEQQLAAASAEYKSAISEDDDKSAEKLAAKMTSLYDRLEAARNKLANEVEKAANKQAAAEEKSAQRAIKAAEKEVAAKKKATQKQFNDLTRPAQRFSTRLMGILSSALVFNVLSAGLREVTTYFGTALKSNNEFSNALAKLKGALLTAFQPIYEIVVPALIYLMQVLTAVVQVIGNFFAAITGKSSSQMAKNADALYNQANATKSAGNAAEKAQKQLMGFDEINKLNDSGASSSGGGGATASAGNAAPNFEGVEITDDLERILYLVGAIGAALLGWKIASMFTDSLSMIGGIAMTVGGAILFAFNWADAFANGIDWGNLSGMLAGLALVVGGLALAFGTTGAAIGLLVGGIALVVLALYEWITTGELSNEACATLVIGIMAIGAAISLLTGSWIPVVVAAVAALVLAFATKGEEIKALLNKVSEWLKNTFAKDWTEVFGPVLGTKLNMFVGIVGGVLGGLKEMLFGIIDFVQGVFTGNWEQAWNGIVGILKGAINGVIGIVNGMISAIVNGINSVFRLLSFNIDLPGGGSIGWSLPQFTAPQIPYLAQGAVIPPNAPFMAVLGDQRNGTNIEAPLSTIEQALRNVMAEQGGGDITINFTGDLAQLARILYPEIHRQDRNTARSRGW